MADSAPVHFFDILSTLPGPSKAWSPNTLKSRIALNYKGIPYTQTFISYPDIAPLLSSFSVEPHPETTPRQYTLPAIIHPSVKSNPSGALMDSFPIAVHLEEQYPSRTLFPSGNASYALAIAVDKLMYNVGFAGYTLVIPSIYNILDPRAQEYYARTRAEVFGKPLEEVRPTDEEEIRGVVEKMKKEMVPIMQMLKRRPGNPGPFFEGDRPGYADFIIAAYMVWFKAADEKIWEEFIGLGDGEVKVLWDACYPWVEGQGEDKDWAIPRQAGLDSVSA